MTIAIQTPARVDDSAAISILTLAFGSDPAVRWMYPESHQHFTWFPAFARAFGGKAFEHGSAYALSSGIGAALWLPPGVEPDEEAILEVLQESVREEERADLFAMFEQMGRAHPAEPHWYLPLIGIDPAYQRKGHGSALLGEALTVCDWEGRSAYLEATSIDSVPLYERHGFEVTGSIQAGSSPRIFPMVRRPR